MNFFATKGLGTWALTGNSLGIGSTTNTLANGEFDFLIAPELPYLYLPDAAQSEAMTKLNSMLSGVTCDNNLRVCYYTQTCDSIKG